MFTSEEQTYLIPLFLLVAGIPVLNFLKKDKLAFWSPLTLVALVYFYYTVLGPWMAINNNQTIYRLIDHRPFYLLGWQGALLAFGSLLIGFNIIHKKFKKPSIPFIERDQLNKYGKNLFIAGFVLFIMFTGVAGLGAQIDFLDGQSTPTTGYSGAFKNYLAYGINFFIPAVVILLIAFQKEKSNIIWLMVFILLATAIYLNAGFRYRLVLLGYGLFSAFYLYKQQKPNPVFLIIAIVVGIGVMGFIQSTRGYGVGLIIDPEETLSNEDYFMKGLEEANVFATTGLLIDQVPAYVDHTGMQFIWEAISFPIPRIIWPDKPAGESLNTLIEIYGGGLLGTGAAVLNYGEHYAAFGWWGIVIFNLLLGMLLKVLWRWFLNNKDNALAIAFYACANAYLYVVISRGYLPQVVFLFFYTVFPAYVIIRFWRRKVKRTARPRHLVQHPSEGSEPSEGFSPAYSKT